MLKDNTTQQAAQIADEIIGLYQLHGDEDYDGEPVSQTAHMIQCAMQAMDGTADIDLIIGAFLHDIGHLLKHLQATEAMGDYGVVNHEGIGAKYLQAKGFSDRVCAMVDMHVQAKRYLVSTDVTYHAKLSEASLQTLQWQGGAMSEEEVKTFEEHQFFQDIIKVRLWDEEAKDPNGILVPLSYFRNLIFEYLNNEHL